MSNLSAPLKDLNYKNSHYLLSVQSGKIETYVMMKLLVPTVSTKHLPLTLNTLEKFLPSIFKAKCINYKKVPFGDEVRATKVGHLFEHILLEYLAQLKRAKGLSDDVYNGVTSWDWKRDEVGTFHIKIDSSSEDFNLFSKALEQTIMLTNMILDAKTDSHDSYLFQGATNISN